ncbi:MAG: hypothetical protein JWN17_380 [Frankiales bacterium]|nr:hypothetical protein [Frankiales bacterium]
MGTTAPSRPTTRRDHRTDVLPLHALDGLPLTLVHVTGRHPPSRGPVLLLHGAGVRAELFRPPLPRTFVDGLLDAGWDVWMGNWRASIDLEPVPWTLDDAAACDHPALVRAVLAQTGARTLKAVVHCQGSSSFVLAAAAGLLPEVDTVVSNAVSLHPVVPAWSAVKLTRLVPLVARLTPSLSPAWGVRSQGPVSRAVTAVVRATHRECDNTVCRLVSFTYGSGHPALWSHDHLDEATHAWVRGEFGGAPMSFFDQMARSVGAGHLVSTRPGLPPDPVAQAPQTDARFVFVAGEDNLCFLPESQQRTFEHFARWRPGRDALHRVRGYGHLDVFLGRHAARDLHPLLLEELSR